MLNLVISADPLTNNKQILINVWFQTLFLGSFLELNCHTSYLYYALIDLTKLEALTTFLCAGLQILFLFGIWDDVVCHSIIN